MVDNAVAKEALTHYLADISEQDTLLLGCTHFPVFKALLLRLLPERITIVDSAEATAGALQGALQDLTMLNGNNQERFVQYLVTDSVSRFQKVGEIFLGEPLPSNQIELVDACS
ncbi:glutamate racemase [Legionella spiritensis]|uniref:Glutamate racemase n=3 Tax=Legionella spiritensis TaxID=452 RepID=A0A0W0YXX2_LEGSP|nr:glutamate racemase [Legionella spiritensis]